jgi:hypothetical protein
MIQVLGLVNASDFEEKKLHIISKASTYGLFVTLPLCSGAMIALQI